MPDRRRSRTALAILTLASLVLLTVDYRQGDDGLVAALQRGALVAFGPLEEAFAGVVEPIGSVSTSVRELGSLREQNADLQAEVAQLRERLPSVADLERENTELRELLNMSERLTVTTTAAKVIGRPPGSPQFSVFIDAGASNGLEPGMAVLNADGLVGKLTQVTRSHARVELLTSPEARYAVRTAASGETGMLRGQGSDPFQIELLNPEAIVEPGAEVVTRTFEGSTIPDGLPVGEVVASPADGNERFLQVRPYVDFTRLSLVQVVLDAPTAPTRLNPDALVDDPDATRPDPPPSESPGPGETTQPEPTATGSG